MDIIADCLAKMLLAFEARFQKAMIKYSDFL